MAALETERDTTATTSEQQHDDQERRALRSAKPRNVAQTPTAAILPSADARGSPRRVWATGCRAGGDGWGALGWGRRACCPEDDLSRKAGVRQWVQSSGRPIQLFERLALLGRP